MLRNYSHDGQSVYDPMFSFMEGFFIVRVFVRLARNFCKQRPVCCVE